MFIEAINIFLQNMEVSIFIFLTDLQAVLHL